MKHSAFDVVVVGGGHAGAEAATAAYRMGVSVCLVTHKFSQIGEMSCNPAIGGVGKGHLVREIDALDGVMGRVADDAGIQFRLLNRRKGPAVRGPRTQADREHYRSAMQNEFHIRPEISIIEKAVVDLLEDKGRAVGVVLADGSEVPAKAVILTTGTFLRGMIHIGSKKQPGGRMGDDPSNALAKRIEDLALPLGRLKTGTPPRLDGRSIDWTKLEMQQADEVPTLFSFLSNKAKRKQVGCGITHTNKETHDIIRDNIGLSAMYGGHIAGVGPRYCPSIEDKVLRFAEKDSHQVFLEPESLSGNIIYPNGISTSLPPDIQLRYVQSMQGLENVTITQPGYAIEYDFVDPKALDHSLETRAMPGLFLAGQINGTTGYEEAAAQGLVAGLNAASCAKSEGQIVFDRADGYIGVMIDDLVTRGVSEPYRMFTSRAEYRLTLRADNADMRLTPLGLKFGCISSERKKVFEQKKEQYDTHTGFLSNVNLTPKEAVDHGLNVNQDGVRRTGLDLLALKDVDISRLLLIWPELSSMPTEIVELIENNAQYSSYIDRQNRDMGKLRREENIEIPADLIFSNIPGLSNELQGKLNAVRPNTLAQAGRIDGMTPAALLLVLAHTKKHDLKRQA